MITFLFLWNPQAFPWDDRVGANGPIAGFAARRQVQLTWSVASHRQVSLGLNDVSVVRAILSRTGRPVRSQGIIGLGKIKALNQGKHFDPERARKGHMLYYADILFEHLFDASEDPLLDRAECFRLAPKCFARLPYASGTRMVCEMEADRLWKAAEGSPKHAD